MKKSDQSIWESWKKSNIKIAYPKDVPIHDRIVGSIMGCFVGDALGLGCHWYYDFNDLWKEGDSYVPKMIESFTEADVTFLRKNVTHHYIRHKSFMNYLHTLLNEKSPN